MCATKHKILLEIYPRLQAITEMETFLVRQLRGIGGVQEKCKPGRKFL